MSSSKKYAFSASFGIYFFSISQSNDVEFFNKYAMKENNPIQDSKSQEKLTSDVVLVRNLVETLKEKLGIPDSMEDIVRTYCDVNAALPRSSEDKPVSRDIPFWLRNLPESARKVYFPWQDVLASMYIRPADVRIRKETCPDCGEPVVTLYFSSPEWTWAEKCGRAGRMKLCLFCPKQLDFDLVMMN